MLKMHSTWTGRQAQSATCTVGGGCVILGMPVSMQHGQGQSTTRTAGSRDQLVVALRVLRRCERRALLARHLADRGDARLG